MRHRRGNSPAVVCLWLVVAGGAYAQDVSPEDANVNAIRADATVDARFVAEWVRAKVDILAAAGESERWTAFVAFRNLLLAEYGNPANSTAYRSQMAKQLALFAEAEFAKADLKVVVAQGLAHTLADIALANASRTEALPGLVAGLKSAVPIARYQCAKGLVALRPAMASDKEARGRGILALREAGRTETSPVVLGRIYEALDYPGQTSDVFDAYIAVFDARLAHYRGPARLIDGCEVDAFEFFRNATVIGALSADQKAELVQRLAVFLRVFAERYASLDIEGGNEERKPVRYAENQERAYIEMMLDGLEEILVAVVGQAGGNLRDQLKVGGFSQQRQVLQEAYGWVGQPQTQASGVLNTPPWNVPIGAP